MIVCDIRACVLYKSGAVGDDVLPVPSTVLTKAKELLGTLDAAPFEADASHYVAMWARAQRRRRGIPETGRWA